MLLEKNINEKIFQMQNKFEKKFNFMTLVTTFKHFLNFDFDISITLHDDLSIISKNESWDTAEKYGKSYVTTTLTKKVVLWSFLLDWNNSTFQVKISVSEITVLSKECT